MSQTGGIYEVGYGRSKRGLLIPALGGGTRTGDGERSLLRKRDKYLHPRSSGGHDVGGMVMPKRKRRRRHGITK